MSKTVVGLFSTMGQAQQAKQALVSKGYQEQSIHVIAQNGGQAGSRTSTAGAIGEKIGGYFRSLTGGDEASHQQYTGGVAAGGAVVSAAVPDEKASEAAMLLKQQGASDLEGGAAQGGYSGEATQSTGGTMIPIVEEQLVVGKREVDHGGVRVFSHVIEVPVEAQVLLREEHINVERHAVNRPATEADFQSANGPAIELTAMAEEAVIGKSSRVVEEVRVGKQSSEHAESIHDTVRKTEGDVEQMGTASGIGERTTTKKPS